MDADEISESIQIASRLTLTENGYLCTNVDKEVDTIIWTHYVMNGKMQTYELHPTEHCGYVVKPVVKDASNPKTYLFLASSCSCLCPIHWSMVLSDQQCHCRLWCNLCKRFVGKNLSNRTTNNVSNKCSMSPGDTHDIASPFYNV